MTLGSSSGEPRGRIEEILLPQGNGDGLDLRMVQEGPEGVEEDGLSAELQKRLSDPSHAGARAGGGNGHPHGGELLEPRLFSGTFKSELPSSEGIPLGSGLRPPPSDPLAVTESKRVYALWKKRSTVPVGPFRCLAMASSDFPSSEFPSLSTGPR